jgi:hypothetical protein
MRSKIVSLFSVAALVMAPALSSFGQQAVIVEKASGTTIGTKTTQKLGFHGSTPTAQRSGSAQSALTDSTTGTAATTLAAGTGVHTVSIPIQLAQITGAGDVLTTYTPGYKFKVLATAFAVTTRVTTAAKAATLNLEIGTTNVTGGDVALTSANSGTLGAVVAGSAVTAANTGTSSDTISIEAASVTAFSEGQGVLLIKLQNMDTADTAASVTRLLNEIRAALVAKGLIKGSS